MKTPEHEAIAAIAKTISTLSDITHIISSELISLRERIVELEKLTLTKGVTK